MSDKIIPTANGQVSETWHDNGDGTHSKTVFSNGGDFAVHPGEDSQFDRTWGGHKWSYSQKTAGGTVKSTAAVYGGYTIAVTTATGAINIRNGTSTGEIIDVIPVGTVAGAKAQSAIAAPLGLYIEFVGGAAGTVNVLYI